MAKGKDRTNEREGSVAVLSKAGALLDLLAARREATASEIAEAMGEPRSSIYRLLGSLRSQGLVEPGTGMNANRLGIKLLQLGAAVTARLDVRLAALPAMERLNEETDQTLLLWLRRSGEAVCIERVEGGQIANVTIRVGDALPLYLGAGPVALLAFAERSDWDAYLASTELTPRRPESLITAASVRVELEDTRRRGYAVADQDLIASFGALGVPIFDHQGKVCAAISISGLRDTILDGEQIGKKAVAAADEVSRSLGWAP